MDLPAARTTRNTRPGHGHRLRVAAGAVTAAAALLGALVAAPSAAAAPDAAAAGGTVPLAGTGARLGADGRTAAVYDYEAAIKESVWVETGDLDGDGEGERIAVDVIRPAELDGVERVPVIMDASPYYSCCGRGNESEKKTYDANGTIESFPLWYDNWFVPRGYAVVQVDMAGTGRSTGCVDQGGRSDVLSVKAAVDWLNGNATASFADGAPADADWTTGATGMIGKSYDGTLANGVAALGTEGLETIVPIGAISSWYDYDRWQGLPFSYGYPSYLSAYVAGGRQQDVDCSAQLERMRVDAADETGEHTAFWDERDYREGTLGDASKVRASALIMHGLQDTNVDTQNFSRWWEALGEHGVERKMFLTRLGHVDPFDSDRAEWVGTLHRWFDHELYGVDNGITEEPAVRAEIAPGQVVRSETWPVTDRVAKLRPGTDGTLAPGARGKKGEAAWTNDPNGRLAQMLGSGATDSRLLFTTGRLTDDLRLSGPASLTTKVTTDAPTGQMAVALVDYGPARRVSASGDGARTVTTESCWGASSAVDDACYRDVERRIEQSDLQVLGRGWARLAGGGKHALTVELQTNDVLVPEGHQLGLVVTSYDGGTVRVDGAASAYRIDLAATTLNLPVRGPMRSFAPGRSLVPEAVGAAAVPSDGRKIP
ncbi:CocE/NonD family hydrolase, partial [Streptomyces chilikensis]|uniref:CocE/NonD family hydrolase n=1 Tax=Streptomyces chilikensis TaxID=1194079 RepID=UPI00140D09E5